MSSSEPTVANPIADATVRPSVLVIVLDTARADHLPPHPAGAELAPRISAEAGRGWVLDRVHAAAPWTLPSHASLFSGAYPSEHGIHGRAAMTRDQRLSTLRNAIEGQAERWLPRAFQAAGYRTWGVSSNPWITAPWGFSFGFDAFSAVGDAAADDRPKRDPEKRQRDGIFTGSYRRLGRAKRVIGQWRGAGDSGGQSAVAFVREQMLESQRPFFGFVNLMEAHVPYSPPKRFNELKGVANLRAAAVADRRKSFDHTLAYNLGLADMSMRDLDLIKTLYRGEIRYLDHLVGQLLDSIPRERTIVVITADHGEAFGEAHTLDHQVTMLEVVLRVPFIVLGPAEPPSTLSSLRDVAEFLAEASGLDPAPWQAQARVPRGVACAEYESAWLFARRTQRIATSKQFPSEAIDRLKQEMAAAVEGDRKLVREGDLERTFELDGFVEREIFEPATRERLAAYLDAARSSPASDETGVSLTAEEESLIESQLEHLGYL